MSFATLMVHVEIASKACERGEDVLVFLLIKFVCYEIRDARVRLAADLAKRFAATLIGRRAVQDALPLLYEAKSVTILEVADDDAAGRRRVDDLAEYLARHRITARTVTEAAAAKPIADQLVNFARADGADLIVTGGYGHSRLGEWIFGGVTSDLLKSSPMCCFFAN